MAACDMMKDVALANFYTLLLCSCAPFILPFQLFFSSVIIFKKYYIRRYVLTATGQKITDCEQRRAPSMTSNMMNTSEHFVVDKILTLLTCH